MANTVNAFSTPGTVLPCSTSIGMVVELRQRGLHLPALAVELGEVGDTVDCGIDQRGDQGDLAGPEARRADRVPHLSEHQGPWQGRQRLLGKP
jgi:hypothetical protein